MSKAGAAGEKKSGGSKAPPPAPVAVMNGGAGPELSALATRLGNAGLQAYLRAAGAAAGAASPALPLRAERDERLEREADAFAARVPTTRSAAPRGALQAPQRVDGRLPLPLEAALREAGEPLDAALRRDFEPALGLRLDAVRIHRGPAAQAAAAALGARAFTYGDRLAFARGAFAPHSVAGRALLAHELAHLRQQAVRGRAFLACQQRPDLAPSQPGEIVTELRPGLIQRSGRGYLRLIAGGREWLRLEWNPAQTTAPEVTFAETERSGGRGYGLRVLADYEVHCWLTRAVEATDTTSMYRLFSYDLRFTGTLEVDGHEVPLPYRHREFYRPERSVEFEERPLPLTPPTPESLEPLADAPAPTTAPDQLQHAQEQAREQDLIRGHPAFDSRAEMEAYIAAHPEESFIGIGTTFGRFVARRVNEAELQRLAGALRSDPDRLPEEAWDAERHRSAWSVTGIYQQGHAVDLEVFANRYYSEDIQAEIGREGELEEAEIYRVGSRSFGRKTLDHDQASARWTALDEMPTATLRRLETEPGHRFYKLRVRGAGRLHEIDEQYFEGRDAFNREIATRPDTGWVALYNAMVESPSAPGITRYLMAQLDREGRATPLVAQLTGRPQLAEAVSRRVYFHVEDRAQQLVLQRIEAGRRQLDPYATRNERMQAFVLGFPDMNAEQRSEALRFLGVPADQQSHVSEMLSTREAALRVALGLEESVTEEEWETAMADNTAAGGAIRTTVTYRVSLEQMMRWAQATLDGYGQAAAQLQSGAVKALRLEGELGTEVRRAVYREMGFHRLDPAGFPHGQETEGWFPDPLDAGSIAFTSLAEQMYANHVRSEASTGTVLHVLAVTAMVVASIAMILIAQEAGVVAAGLLFAEGSAAFVATEIVVSGLVMTALAEMQTRVLEGRWSEPGEVVGHAALNIATFGAFRYLNTLLAAGARSFVTARVGGEEAFVASRGAQRAPEALRIGGIGATFFTLGIGQRLASGQGFSSWGDFALFAYENLLTLALLEGGAHLARPLMTESGIWARQNRLGVFETEITALRGESVRLQRDLASLAARPQAAERDAPALAERTTQLLETQRALCERLRESFRTRSDARALEAQAGAELQAIDAALGGIRQAQFLRAQRITPIEGSESVFSYEGGSAAVERFREFYGSERVRAAEDGTLRVEVPGLETGELVFVPAESLAPPVGAPAGAAPTVPTIVERQIALRARQQALLARARRLGVTDPTLTAISAARLQVAQRTRPEALDAAERLIAEAERVAGAEMENQTRNVLANLRRRLGARAIDQIRAGELAGVTDADLADVLWQARGLKNMGVAQLRALVFAARPGEPAIDFPRLLRTIRSGGFNVADRNFALETFTQMMELRIPGARQTLADMARSTGSFRGGLFEMEAIRYLGGVEQVRGSQVRRAIGARAREYDIELTNGTRVECKDWATWEYAEESLGDPFARDMLALTDNFANPAGMRRLRYLFRSPPPRSVENIRLFLRGRLERLLTERGADRATRDAMLAEFDDYLLLVEAPDLQRTGGVPLPDPRIAPPPGPPPRRDEDDEDAGTAGN